MSSGVESRERAELAFDQIPQELRALPQWIAWWSVVGEGVRVKLPGGGWTKPLKKQEKPHKLPINPLTGRLAATTRSNTWSTFENACAAVQRWSVTGIGFVFTGSDPNAGVDIDNCRNPETEEIEEWAWVIIRALDSYTEISPSGTGVHIFVRAQLPSGQSNQVKYHGGKVEMFSRDRYFTFTGVPVDGTPTGICDRQAELLALHSELFGNRQASVAPKNYAPSSTLPASDSELIEKARRAKNGPKFDQLWKGQWAADYPSQSEADFGLCVQLAFWTGKDPVRMDAMFRRSGLMRKKWLQKSYRDRTLAKAIATTSETWNPCQRAPRQKGPEGGISVEPGVGQLSPGESAPLWDAPVPLHQFELPPFPVEALSGWLRAFVEDEAMATQTPVDLSAMLGLSVVSAACAKRIVVQIKPGYREPVNIYTVTTLPSGSRKSAVFADATAPLEEYERSEAKRTAGEIAKARAAYKIKEARLRRLQEQAAGGEAKGRDRWAREAEELAEELAKTRIPVPLSCLADDCTPEKIPGLLADNGGRIAVMSPEGDVFDLMAGRYSSKKAANFGVFLKGHAGDTIRVDRVGRPPEYVHAPAITIGLAVQPDVVRGLASQPGFRGRGLLARLLFSKPLSLLGRRKINAPAVPDQTLADYRAGVLALLNLQCDRDAGGDSCPHVLMPEPDARESLLEFEKWIEPQLGEFGALGNMSDWGGKIVGAVARIAGLLHMAAMTGGTARWQTPLTDSTMRQAIQIGRYLIPHARAAFAEMGADLVVENAKKILRWIEHEEFSSFTRRDAHQAMRSTFTHAEQLDASLNMLVEHRLIRQQPNHATGRGRPPGPAFDVNPRWDRRHESAIGIGAGQF
jgi:hypothetical protein